jgi:hypothetical protein
VWQSRDSLTKSLRRTSSATERANAVALALTEVEAIDRAPFD